MTVAAIAAFVLATPRSAESLPTYGILTADIPAGQRIAPDDVRFEPADLPAASLVAAVTNADEVIGAIARVALRRGQFLDPRQLATDPEAGGRALPSVHQLSIPVPTDRAPAGIEPGDLVTLLAHDEAAAATIVVLEDAVVLAFERDPERIGRAGTAQLTLAIDDPSDVVGSVQWSYSPLTVVLTTGAASDAYPPNPTRPQPHDPNGPAT